MKVSMGKQLRQWELAGPRAVETGAFKEQQEGQVSVSSSER